MIIIRNNELFVKLKSVNNESEKEVLKILSEYTFLPRLCSLDHIEWKSRGVYIYNKGDNSYVIRPEIKNKHKRGDMFISKKDYRKITVEFKTHG